jgi:hypothetical protein
MTLLSLCTLVSLAILSYADVLIERQNSSSFSPLKDQSLRSHPAEGFKLGVQPPHHYPLSTHQLAPTYSSRVMFSKKFKFYACLIPKCASSSWLELMYEMHLSEAEFQRIKENAIAPMDLPKNGLYDLVYGTRKVRFSTNAKEARGALGTPGIFKFTVVRHPWDRLISGYLNKYVFECKKSRACFKKNYVPNLRNNRLRVPMSLTELLFTLEQVPTSGMNQHFRPSTEVCNVRDGPYDFIADMDNPAHTEYLLAKIKSPFPFPQENVLRS